MKIYVTVVLTFLSLKGVCQIPFKEYFDRMDAPCAAGDCFYYKQGVANKHGFYQDTVKSFYCNGSVLRSVEVYDEKGNLNGVATYYYPSGQLREKVRYRDNVRFGNATSYYKNGKPQMSSIYPDRKNFRINALQLYLVVNYLDSLGNFEVKNMKGFCSCAGSYFGDEIIEKGKILNGVRDSVWTAYKNDQILFQENYSKGDFQNGVSYTGDVKSEYSKFEELPEFVGGMPALMLFLSKKMTYPTDARRMGIDGKVFVQFVVNEDGSISDIEVIKSLSSSTDQEAMRVVKLMPHWIPGKLRGIPVKVKFVLPLRFKLDL